MLIDEIEWEHKDLLKKCTLIKAQNVCDYYYSGTSQEVWGAGDFPNVAPPWPQFWIEYRQPQKIVTDRVNPELLEHPELVTVTKLRSGVYEKLYRTPQPRIGFFIVPFDAGDELKEKVPGLRWAMAIDSFVPEYNARTSALFFVDNSGQLMELSAKGQAARHISDYLRRFKNLSRMVADTNLDNAPDGTCFLPARIIAPPVIRTHLEEYIWDHHYVCFLAISFCHCKNVKLTCEVIPEKVQKKRAKSDKLAVERFYTLGIEQMKKVLSTEGHRGEVGLQRALHICRGHFADYTDGRGLFGKHHGVFWVPQHTKGSSAHGTIKKDYEIKSPVTSNDDTEKP